MREHRVFSGASRRNRSLILAQFQTSDFQNVSIINPRYFKLLCLQ